MDKGRIDSKEECEIAFRFLKKNPKMGAVTLEEEEEEEEEEKGVVVVPRGIMVLLANALLKGGLCSSIDSKSVLDVRALCVLFLLRNARIFFSRNKKSKRSGSILKRSSSPTKRALPHGRQRRKRRRRRRR